MLPPGQITEEQYDRTFNANVKGLLFTVQKAIPLMPAPGSIVLNASIFDQGNARVQRLQCHQGGGSQLCPRMGFGSQGQGNPDQRREPRSDRNPRCGRADYRGGARSFKAAIASQVPLGRIGQPDEIVKAIVFFAFDDASYVNAIELFVDGGMAQV